MLLLMDRKFGRLLLLLLLLLHVSLSFMSPNNIVMMTYNINSTPNTNTSSNNISSGIICQHLQMALWNI